jgi:hypothetical protein
MSLFGVTRTLHVHSGSPSTSSSNGPNESIRQRAAAEFESALKKSISEKSGPNAGVAIGSASAIGISMPTGNNLDPTAAPSYLKDSKPPAAMGMVAAVDDLTRSKLKPATPPDVKHPT